MGARPRAEDFEDQARAVNDLRVPAPFQVALLYRTQHAIEDNQTDPVIADKSSEVFEGPTSEEAAWLRAGDPGDLGTDHIEANRPRETDRFLQSGLDGATRDLCRLLARRRFQRGMHYKRSTGRGAVRARRCVCAAQDSAISLLGSNSWIGCPGITVEIACLYTS